MLSFIPEFIEILSSEGWIEVKNYTLKSRLPILTFDNQKKISYLPIMGTSTYDYKGPLLEIETESCLMYTKPTSWILSDGELVKSKELVKGSNIDRYHMSHEIVKMNIGEWEGKLYRLDFKDNVTIPVKFQNDYYIIG
jgi:hypothetical protein